MIDNRECWGCMRYTIVSYMGINFYDSCMNCPNNVRDIDEEVFKEAYKNGTWYMNASPKKTHCTKYRDTDAFALMSITAASNWNKSRPAPEVDPADPTSKCIEAKMRAESRVSIKKGMEGYYDHPMSQPEEQGTTYMGVEVIPSDVEEALDNNEVPDTIYTIQKYCEGENPDSIKLRDMLNNMDTRSKRLATYNVAYSRMFLKTSSLNSSADEATGRTGASMGASRGTAIIGTEEVKVLDEADNKKLMPLLKNAQKMMKKFRPTRHDSFQAWKNFAMWEQAYHKTLQAIVAALRNSTTYALETVQVTGTHLGTHPITGIPLATYNSIGTNVMMKVDGKVNKHGTPNMIEFYSRFDMHKHNYVGTVNKKSDGRDPRTGSYPDPKSTDMMKLYRHQPSLIITPNTINTTTTRQLEVQYLDLDTKTRSGKMKKEVTIVSRGPDCECGCNVKVKDMRRGEILCPQCGIVYGRAVGDDV